MELLISVKLFQKLLSPILIAFSPKKGKVSEVCSEELLGRFISQRNRKAYIRPSNGTVKHNAFMPAKDGELSVYRISGLSNEEAWKIADEYVATESTQILGHAEIFVRSVINEKLSVEPAPKPHRLHANIIKWPSLQSEQKLIALKLAAASTLKLRP